MTSASKCLRPMLATQVRNANIKLEQIAAVAAHLADLMEDAHGGSFRVQIDHKLNLIAITRRRDRHGS